MHLSIGRTAVNIAAKPAGRQSVRVRVSAAAETHVINIIPNNGRWETGVPPVMGAHLMASGTVAPVSVSKGAGIDVYPPDVAYYTAEGDAGIQIGTTPEAAVAALVCTIAEASEKAIASKGSFTLVLSGGSLPTYLAELAVVSEKYKRLLAWDKTHIFFVDERNVPHSSADSTLKACKEALLSKVPIPAENIHAIMENLPTKKAALQYEGSLLSMLGSTLTANTDGFPVFDCIVLGLGADGHVASLFPHKDQLKRTDAWVLPVFNSPKPPAERITMTMPVINAAQQVIFFALGSGKADIVQRTLETQALPGSLPAQLVRPTNGVLTWILDMDASQALNPSTWDEPKDYPRSQVPKKE